MQRRLSAQRWRILAAATIAIGVGGALILAEPLVAIISPQPTMFPRWEFSSDYGFISFRNAKIIHEMPNRWRFEYTTNEYRNRGKAIALSNEYAIPNIVVLGDSHSFGIGVNDGEEYPAVMHEILEGSYNVTNLSVPGWGLAQQIRRYYEFGQLYSPQVVLLQFCINDLDDNLNNRVTVIEDGRFKFVESDSKINWFKKYLSQSIIQKSQIYNLLRDSAYRFFASRRVRAVEKTVQEGRNQDIPVRERIYNDLLQVFAKDLKRRRVRLLMIAANHQLDRAPFVRSKMAELEVEGSLEYIEVADFFSGTTDFGSPEGHVWGAGAHRILGERLALAVTSAGAATGRTALGSWKRER